MTPPTQIGFLQRKRSFLQTLSSIAAPLSASAFPPASAPSTKASTACASSLLRIRPLVVTLALCAGLLGLSQTAHAAYPSADPARDTFAGLLPVNGYVNMSMRQRIVHAGLEAVGTPYAWGGDDPDGFDCSGFVKFIYEKMADIDLPRIAREQRSHGKAVAVSQLKPGDLVFFATTRRRHVTSHVGLYIGNDEFVHAPHTGARIRVDSLASSYWSERYTGARRYLPANAAPSFLAQTDETPQLVASADDSYIPLPEASEGSRRIGAHRRVRGRNVTAVSLREGEGRSHRIEAGRGVRRTRVADRAEHGRAHVEQVALTRSHKTSRGETASRTPAKHGKAPVKHVALRSSASSKVSRSKSAHTVRPTAKHRSSTHKK